MQSVESPLLIIFLGGRYFILMFLGASNIVPPIAGKTPAGMKKDIDKEKRIEKRFKTASCKRSILIKALLDAMFHELINTSTGINVIFVAYPIGSGCRWSFPYERRHSS
ncbi:hypothetical protein ACQKL5_14140 [Peribacillus sp. NPDC097675]|uniref:hypothetical protein n=1 Tax=Peribacillus sp. NPDC097675 TaxID=3390618 RepID=UPI003D0413AF